MNVSVAIVGKDAEPFEAAWNPTTKRLSWTATGLPHSFLTLQVNDKTDYVVTAGKRWHPNPDGYVFLPEHSTQIAFHGDGAEPKSIAYNPDPFTNIISGFAVDLSNKSLTTCTLALRASLDLVNPSWETSEINLGFILPDVTPDALQFIATIIDGAYISYSARYDDTADTFASQRRFTCTTEGITLSDNGEITLTGVDQSEKLSKTQVPRYFEFTYGAGFERLYALFRSFISNAGISVSDVEEAPRTTTDGDADLIAAVYLEEKSYADYVMYFMRHMILTESHASGSAISFQYYPRYVDAGRPKITWRYPEVKWVIDKQECGNIQYGYEPAVKTLEISNDLAVSGDSREAIETKTVKNGHRYAFDMQTPHRSFAVTGQAVIVKQNCMRVVVRATADGDITLRGIPIEFADDPTLPDPFTYGTYGQDIDVEGDWHFAGAVGLLEDGSQVELARYEDWYGINGISQTVTFTWKGDPRMQPLDVFLFNGIAGAWTIESITLDHTGGGLSAEITARRGTL